MFVSPVFDYFQMEYHTTFATILGHATTSVTALRGVDAIRKSLQGTEELTVCLLFGEGDYLLSNLVHTRPWRFSRLHSIVVLDDDRQCCPFS